jgi:hypothetical protein
MLEFLFGFGVGIMIGTKCNCNPYIDFIFYTIKNTLEDVKNDIKSPRRNNEKTVDEILLSRMKNDESSIDTLLNDEIKKEI